MFLLSVAEAESLGRDLTGRTLWIGMEMTLDEIELVREGATDAEQTAAARITARLPTKSRSDA